MDHNFHQSSFYSSFSLKSGVIDSFYFVLTKKTAQYLGQITRARESRGKKRKEKEKKKKKNFLPHSTLARPLQCGMIPMRESILLYNPFLSGSAVIVAFVDKNIYSISILLKFYSSKQNEMLICNYVSFVLLFLESISKPYSQAQDYG